MTGNDVSGALCISQPWPGMARSIFGDHQRFVDAYFKPYPGKCTPLRYKGGVACVPVNLSEGGMVCIFSFYRKVCFVF